MALRILLASDFYAPFIGGAELQVQYYARLMRRRGHVASVATVWHAGLASYQDDDGVGVHRLKGWTTAVPWFSSDAKRRFHPPFPDPGIVWGLRRLIARLRPDVVHANGWIGYSCAAALLGSDVPLVLSVRDYGYTCAIRTLMYGDRVCDGPSVTKCLGCAASHYGAPKAAAAVGGVFAGRRLLARKTAATHSVSRFVHLVTQRDLFVSGPGDGGALGVTIPDMTPPANVAEATEHGGASQFSTRLPSEPYILFVGALQPHKGLQPLLAAYARLEAPPPLVLIGSVWPETPSIFPPGVTVLRDVAHADVMSAWERCLFGVTPSVWPDPLPGVVKEAMSKGKPVVGSRVGGIVDMIAHEETGLLVEPGDVDGLARAMARLISDDDLRERLGRRARESVACFDRDAILPGFESLYDRIVGAAPAGR